MSVPRLAILGPPDSPAPSGSPATLALLAGLDSRGWRVQHFDGRACPARDTLVPRATGLPGRHLDPWLMPEDLLRAAFRRGARRADLAVVEGAGDAGPPVRAVARALDLPIVAIVRCRTAASFHMPRMSGPIDAVLLDGLDDPDEFPPLKAAIESVFGLTVLGGVEALPEARAALAMERPGDPAVAVALARLAQSFLKTADLPGLCRLAAPRTTLGADPVGRPVPTRRFRVAYAQDAAFGRYCPDSLDTLEALGAELVEFSPLADEALPPDCDLAILGCGEPERHAEAVAANLSLIGALRAFVCDGRRIYAEGGGAAYLGRSILVDGRSLPAAGVFPFVAEPLSCPAPPIPVERVLTRETWLGPAGTVVRGYRSGRWALHPAPQGGPCGDCPAPAGPLSFEGDLYARHHAVGGLVHLHLASLTQVVAAFSGPHRPSLSLPRRDP